jgi:hypothetical protein
LLEKVRKEQAKKWNEWFENIRDIDKRKQEKGWYLQTLSGNLVRIKWVAKNFPIDMSPVHTTDLRHIFKFFEQFGFEIVEVK